MSANGAGGDAGQGSVDGTLVVPTRPDGTEVVPMSTGRDVAASAVVPSSAATVFSFADGEALPSTTEGLPRYVDSGEIARGGMAVVHRAVDVPLQREVAIKRLQESLESEPDAVRRFVLEAQITGQLDHPNIVPVHHLATDAEGRRFFSMKLVRGRTLAEAIHDGPSLPCVGGRLDALLEVLLKVCDAVAFAHDRGVIHRDIKPENVLVGTFGQVYLMDWGVALLRGDATRPPIEPGPRVTASGEPHLRYVVGTPAYMAPEQLTGDPSRIDERTDVYQLGGLLYEMLTGRPPHQLEDVGPRMVAVVMSPVPPPQSLLAVELPRGLCRIAERALTVDPSQRYPSAPAFKAAIEQYLRHTDRFETRTFSPGELIVEEGQDGDCAYILTAGLAVAFKTVDGERKVLRNLGPGDVFGETAVLTRKPRSASVEAVDPVSAIVVTRESMREQLGSSWLSAFVSALAERFREVDARLTELERQRSTTRPPR